MENPKVRSMFETPGRRDRRFEEYVALSVARTPWPGGYTSREHDAAMDRLLADLKLEEPTTPHAREDREILVRPVEPSEDDSRFFLTVGC